MANDTRTESGHSHSPGFTHHIDGSQSAGKVAVGNRTAVGSPEPQSHRIVPIADASATSAVSASSGPATVGAKIAIALLRAYQIGFSSWRAPTCRFVPSCSEYALGAYASHRFFPATWLTMKRVCKCHPWGAYGYDPVPSVQARHVSGDAIQTSGFSNLSVMDEAPHNPKRRIYSKDY